MQSLTLKKKKRTTIFGTYFLQSEDVLTGNFPAQSEQPTYKGLTLETIQPSPVIHKKYYI